MQIVIGGRATRYAAVENLRSWVSNLVRVWQLSCSPSPGGVRGGGCNGPEGYLPFAFKILAYIQATYSSSHSATMMNWPSQRTRQAIMTAAVVTILLIVFPSIIILVIFSNDTKKQPSSSSSSYHQSIRRLEEETDGPIIIMNEISLQKQEQEQNQQPQLSPEELQEKHIKQYLGGLYPKVDRQFHPLYLRDTLHPREIDPKWGEVVDGDIPFFW
eukprot:scaffold3142_cov56-Cyclotella_meneghiniana.AAC.2